MKRRWKWWRRRQRLMRISLRGTQLHRALGDRIMHSHLWALDSQAVAGGLALGLFIAFTPTIPFQMFLCALGALFFRVNLPIALAACWITNPVTAVPIYLAERRLGKHLFAQFWILRSVLEPFRAKGRGGRFIEESTYLWAGALLFGTVSAVTANVLARLVGKIAGHPQAKRPRPPRPDRTPDR